MPRLIGDFAPADFRAPYWWARTQSQGRMTDRSHHSGSRKSASYRRTGRVSCGRAAVDLRAAAIRCFAAVRSMSTPRELLHSVFGYDTFRGPQEAIVSHV